MAPIGVVSVSPVARRGHQAEEEGHADGNEAQADADVKGDILHGQQADRDRDQARHEPPEGDLDRGHAPFELRGRRDRPPAPEGGERTRNGPPLQGERRQARKHHDRRPAPERPARQVIDGAAADERDGDLVGGLTRMGDIHRDQRRPHPQVKQEAAGQHGKADAQTHDHAGAEEQHAGSEPKVDELAVVDREIAVGRDEVGQVHVRFPEEPVEHPQRALIGVEHADDEPGHQPADEHISLAQGLRAVAVEAFQGGGGRHARGKRQLLLVDHLPFHRHGQEDAQRAGEQREGGDHPHRLVVAFEQQECAEGRGHRGAGRVPRRRGGGLHAVVFQDRHRGDPSAGNEAEEIPDDVGHHAGGDRDPKGPADLERGVEVGGAHQHPEHAPHEHGAQGQLRHVVALIHEPEPVGLGAGWIVGDGERINDGFGGGRRRRGDGGRSRRGIHADSGWAMKQRRRKGVTKRARD